MRKTLLFLFLCSFFQLWAQSNLYSKVKIWLLARDLSELTNLSIATDHGTLKKDVWFVTDLSQNELEEVREAGFDVEVLIEDVQKYYKEQNWSVQTKGIKSNICGNNDFQIPVVENYSVGSMGGFLTYQEMLNNLDSMVAKYPNLISARAPIDTFTTIENRPIYWLRISNTPNTDDFSKPEILYTALHHAREPASMQQLIYYMWYLLENYGNDPELSYVMNNIEMYFVPCINPDGYIYNEQTDPNGGGMHRKNRRNVGSNNKGVDLNRNYSYEFGGPGTSSNPDSDTYKGTGPFSEPETRAMEWFTINHNFSITLNYHSYADALLFPWGYENSFQCPDHDLYTALSSYMVKENNYDNYQSALLYEAAGDSDDWAYGEQNDKPKVFAMTPEVGGNSDGFWPSQQNILGICRENVFQNFAAAQSLLDAYELEDLSASMLTSPNFAMDFQFQRLGLQNANYTLNLTALDIALSNVNNPQIISGLDFGETSLASFTGDIDEASVQNNQLTFVMEIATSTSTRYDTFVKYYGETVTVFDGSDGSLNAWSSNDDWGLDNDAYSPPTSIGDSPGSDYSNNESNVLISNSIDLRQADVAIAEFFAKWEIEKGYDYVQISASVDGSSWTPLCGNYTVIGNNNQAEDEPLYDGLQAAWVRESLDLSAFLGEEIQLRFLLKSDQFSRGEGFNFDDFKVITIGGNPTAIKDLSMDAFRVYPNPTNSKLTIEYPSLSSGRLEIVNLMGQVVKSVELKKVKQELWLEDMNTGIYWLKVYHAGQLQGVQKLLIQD